MNWIYSTVWKSMKFTRTLFLRKISWKHRFSIEVTTSWFHEIFFQWRWISRFSTLWKGIKFALYSLCSDWVRNKFMQNSRKLKKMTSNSMTSNFLVGQAISKAFLYHICNRWASSMHIFCLTDKTKRVAPFQKLPKIRLQWTKSKLSFY